MVCILPGISLGSTSASLIGLKIGCANITTAKFYWRSAFIVQILVSIAESILLSGIMILFFNRVTQSKELQDELESVYALFIANVFLDSTRAMLKGVLRALGTQNHVVIYHILW